MGFDGLSDPRTEPLHVVYDPDADVVIVSSPDLTLRLDAGDVLWRETKTSTSLPPDITAALQRYPGFCLNVSMLAAGADGAEPGRGIVELEALSPDGAQIYPVPLNDGALVSECQRIVGEIARTWAADLDFPPRPSGACASCDAHRWCDPPRVAPASRPHVDDDEFAGHADPF